MRVSRWPALGAITAVCACASTRAGSVPAPGPGSAVVAPAPARAAPTPAPIPAAPRGRVAAFSVGHGERSSERKGGGSGERFGVTALREILVRRSFEVRTIGGDGGLGAEIPAELSLLLIVGPERPFRADELAALEGFVARGGRLLVALDHENKIDLQALLAPLGVTFQAEPLANEDSYARRTNRDDDRGNLVTAAIPPDGPLSMLARLAGRAALIFPGAGHLDVAPRVLPSGDSVRSAVKAHPRTFVDRNGNFRFDPGEERAAFDLAAAVSKGRARVFVIADADVVSDLCVPAMQGNSFLAIDIVDWLAP